MPTELFINGRRDVANFEEVSGIKVVQRIDDKCDFCEEPLFTTAVRIECTKIMVYDGKVVKKAEGAKVYTVCDGCFSRHVFANGDHR
jgi:hypothetical protein